MNSEKDKNKFKPQVSYLFENQVRKIPVTVPAVVPMEDGDQRIYRYNISIGSLVSGANSKYFKILIKFVIQKGDYKITLKSLNVGDACYPNSPCKNGGTCTSTGSTKFRCNCANLLPSSLKKGGPTCETDLCSDEVSPNL